MAEELMTPDRARKKFEELYGYFKVPCDPNWELEYIAVNVLSKMEFKMHLSDTVYKKVRENAPIQAITFGLDMALWNVLEKLSKYHVIHRYSDPGALAQVYTYKFTEAFICYVKMMDVIKEHENKRRRQYRFAKPV